MPRLTPSEARAIFDATPITGGRPSDDAGLLHVIERIIARHRAEAAAEALREAADALPWHVHAPTAVRTYLRARADAITQGQEDRP